MPDRADRGAADLANPLRNIVGSGENLLALLVQHQMVVAKARTGDVPVEVLRFEVKREHVGEQDVERARDIFDRVGFQVSRRGKRSGPQ
jgi:hypothetical protein